MSETEKTTGRNNPRQARSEARTSVIPSKQKILTSSLSDLSEGPEWRGAVDQFHDGEIGGWIVSTQSPLRSVELDVFILGVKVLTTISGFDRDDIVRLVKLPVKSGFLINIKNLPPAAARKALVALKAVETTSLPLPEFLQVKVGGTDAVVPFFMQALPKEVSVEAYLKLLAPLTMEFDEGQSELIKLRNDLLAIPIGRNGQDAKVIAYYLPQFHPFAENDEWWGNGFTEWTNVTSAKPQFPTHYQPHLPADLGYYDLRLDQVQKDQIDLAKRYGISGFCYYYYWFSGQTLMTLPLERHLAQNLDLDFCLCWANESWSRRWDGSESDVLMQQRHTFESDVEFIRSCIKYFHSPRYIKVDGAPLLQVYRVSLMQRPVETIERWREIVREEGFPDLHVCMVETFGLSDPHRYGCDSSCQFPPHGLVSAAVNSEIDDLVSGFSGLVYSYADIVRTELSRPAANHLQFRAAMPSWDNTARKGAAANIFAGATPALFEAWMRYLVEDAVRRLPEDHRFVFVNAWNEWAEGAHLEPDRKNGHSNLQAVRAAIMPQSVALAPLLPPTDGSDDRLSATREYVESLINANRALTSLIRRDRYDLRLGEEFQFTETPATIMDVSAIKDGIFNIDLVNGRSTSRHSTIAMSAHRGISVRGWFAVRDRNTQTAFLGLRSTEGGAGTLRYVAPIHRREERKDVLLAYDLEPSSLHSGFSVAVSFRGVKKGTYELEILCPDALSAKKAVAIPTTILVRVQ